MYNSYCTHCHQSDGQGIDDRFPPLARSEWINDDKIALTILYGLQGPITVREKSYNNVMAAWRNLLSDEEIAGVITYVRSSWGNTGDPYSPEKVRQLREQFKERPSFTARELKEKIKNTD